MSGTDQKCWWFWMFIPQMVLWPNLCPIVGVLAMAHVIFESARMRLKHGIQLHFGMIRTILACWMACCELRKKIERIFYKSHETQRCCILHFSFSNLWPQARVEQLCCQDSWKICWDSRSLDGHNVWWELRDVVETATIPANTPFTRIFPMWSKNGSSLRFAEHHEPWDAGYRASLSAVQPPPALQECVRKCNELRKKWVLLTPKELSTFSGELSLEQRCDKKRFCLLGGV